MRIDSETIGARLAAVQDDLSFNQKEIAEFLGLSLRGWQNLVYSKSNPSAETLVKLKEKGISADWILTGEGSMRPDDRRQAGHVHSGDTSKLDPALLGRITDTVAAVYKEAKARLSPRDLGIIGAEKYSEIVAASDTPDEWPGMIKLMAAQLRKELAAPVTDDSKASA